MPNAPFRLLGRRVDPSRHVVTGPDGERALEPKVMQVLCALADRQGVVLTRDELISEVWGRSFGADESLTRAISLLRRTFDDPRENPVLIETVPKRGYRLMASVEPDCLAASPEHTAGIAARRPTARAIAAIVCVFLMFAAAVVLALYRPDSGEPGSGATSMVPGVVVLLRSASTSGATPANARIAGSLSRQVASGLARAGLLRVIEPASKTSPAQIAGESTAFLVDQTVMDRDAGIRVAVIVRDFATGRLLWAQNFDRNGTPSVAQQDALASAITAVLTNRLLIAAKASIRQRPFSSLRPWELNLLATWVPGSDEVSLRPHRADRFLPQQRALQLDSSYAPAHATWASQLSYDALFNAEPASSASRREAAEHAEKALALAPYDPDVLYAVATYYRQIGARAQAVATLDRVLAVQPDHPLAGLDRTYDQGLCTPAADVAIRRLKLDLDGLAVDNPIRWVVLSRLADLYLASGDPARAVSSATRSRDVVQSTWNGFTLAVARAASGDPAEAAATSSELRREWPGLDYAAFSKRSLSAWCLNGPDQSRIGAALDRTAAAR